MQLSADEIPNISPGVINKLIQQLFEKATPNTDDLFKQTLNVFETAINKGFSKDLKSIAFDSPDFELLNNLKYNVGVFSAFKNHSQITETVKLLTGEDGRIRPFKDFKTEALKLDRKYNKQWLRVEYDQAITSARSARRWNDIQRTKDLYPNLRYVAVNDGRTRQLHRNWHNMVLPIDHPFWSTHYPPNDYGCRCVARRSDDEVNDLGVAVDDMPKLPPQFNTNVGVEGKVFNNEHPYFKTANFKEVALLANRGLFKLQRKEILSSLRDQQIIGSSFKSQIGEVIVSKKGVNEIFGNPHSNKYLRNNLLYDVENLLKKAIYIRTNEDIKNNKMIKQYHYMLVDIKKNKFYLNIRELTTGELYLYAITEKLK